MPSDLRLWFAAKRGQFPQKLLFQVALLITKKEVTLNFISFAKLVSLLFILLHIFRSALKSSAVKFTKGYLFVIALRFKLAA